MRTQRPLKRRNRAAAPALLAVAVGLFAVLLPAEAMADGDSVAITSPVDGSTITDLGDPANPTISQGAVTVTFTAVGAPTTCSFDSQPATACTSPVSYPNVAAGPHTVTVAAGAATATTGFTVQTVFLGPPPEGDLFWRTPVTARWRVGARTTTVRLLRVNGLPRRTHVRLTCAGRGCPSRAVHTTTARGKVDLTPLLRGHALRPGTRISIHLRYRSGGGATSVYTIHRGARPTLESF